MCNTHAHRPRLLLCTIPASPSLGWKLIIHCTQIDHYIYVKKLVPLYVSMTASASGLRCCNFGNQHLQVILTHSSTPSRWHRKLRYVNNNLLLISERNYDVWLLIPDAVCTVTRPIIVQKWWMRSDGTRPRMRIELMINQRMCRKTRELHKNGI